MSKQEAFETRLKVKLHLAKQETLAFLISRINLFPVPIVIARFHRCFLFNCYRIGSNLSSNKTYTTQRIPIVFG